MTLEAPWDEWAERTVTGCAVASAQGARLARERLTADDFWSPELRRIFAAAVTLPEQEDDEARIAEVSCLAGVPAERVRALVDERSVMWDKAGGFARRIRDAANRRRVMTYAARLYNRIGEGATLAEVTCELAEIERALSC